MNRRPLSPEMKIMLGVVIAYLIALVTMIVLYTLKLVNGAPVVILSLGAILIGYIAVRAYGTDKRRNL